MQEHVEQHEPRPWPIIAVAAWALPGAGHALLGCWTRAVILGVILQVIFVGGLLIGGVGVVDRTHSRLAFSCQVFIGPMALVSAYAHNALERNRQAQIETHAERERLAVDDYDDDDTTRHDGPALADMLERDIPPAYRTPIGRVEELGTLYTAVAGLLNLLVILDAVGRASIEEAEPDAPRPADSESTQPAEDTP